MSNVRQRNVGVEQLKKSEPALTFFKYKNEYRKQFELKK